ncbi:MAG: AAA family ATPase [Solirubrobacteraceae bacterium]
MIERDGKLVVSGAPGTGKSTVAAAVASELGFPLLRLDAVKERLADVLGCRDEAWSFLIGDAAAEVVFGLSASFPNAVVEGWWRGDRRRRAETEFTGYVQIFCHCARSLVEQRMRARLVAGRHKIHRDSLRPDAVNEIGALVEAVRPLALSHTVIIVDTNTPISWGSLFAQVRAAHGLNCALRDLCRNRGGRSLCPFGRSRSSTRGATASQLSEKSIVRGRLLRRAARYPQTSGSRAEFSSVFGGRRHACANPETAALEACLRNCRILHAIPGALLPATSGTETAA